MYTFRVFFFCLNGFHTDNVSLFKALYCLFWRHRYKKRSEVPKLNQMIPKHALKPGSESMIISELQHRADESLMRLKTLDFNRIQEIYKALLFQSFPNHQSHPWASYLSISFGLTDINKVCALWVVISNHDTLFCIFDGIFWHSNVEIYIFESSIKLSVDWLNIEANRAAMSKETDHIVCVLSQNNHNFNSIGKKTFLITLTV